MKPSDAVTNVISQNRGLSSNSIKKVTPAAIKKEIVSDAANDAQVGFRSTGIFCWVDCYPWSLKS